MLAPGYKRSGITFSKKELRKYKRRLNEWLKQYMKDFHTQIDDALNNNPSDEYRYSLFPVDCSPNVLWDEIREERIAKTNDPSTNYSYYYYPSELMAMSIYSDYGQKGISEREVFKDFLYLKESHINKVAAKGFKKRPAWWKPEPRKDDLL